VCTLPGWLGFENLLCLLEFVELLPQLLQFLLTFCDLITQNVCLLQEDFHRCLLSPWFAGCPIWSRR
jgi:hypothetical protein